MPIAPKQQQAQPFIAKSEFEDQESPFAIQVELTEGCTLACKFCGINGIRQKPGGYKFLTVEKAQIIIQRIVDSGWNSRIEFAMHGEPSMNPNMLEIMAMFRKALPKHHIMMTSNGSGFVKDTTAIDKILESINVLATEDYAGIRTMSIILDRYTGSHKPIYYPDDKNGNPHRRRRVTEHDWVIIRDIAHATNGTHSLLNNHTGCGSPKNADGVGKRCAKPFRELSIRWDGTVAICCNDFRGYYRCGSVIEQTIEEVWNSPAFKSARRKLYHGLRDFGPCAGCDAVSYRTGLLPDKKGSKKLPLPTPEDLKAIEAALADGPLTLPVLREWELQQ